MPVRHRLAPTPAAPGPLRRRVVAVGATSAALCAAFLAPAAAATGPVAGRVVVASPAPAPAAPTTGSHPAPGRSATGTVDISTRAGSLALWQSGYTPAPDPGWTGSVAGCSAGTTTPAFKDAVGKRINYFRAMAGAPAPITIDPVTSAKAQQTALMMSANGTLNHFPPTTWNCYTQDGHDGAASSNLALGTYGTDAVDAYMQDSGDGNSAAGHRRWLLYPQTQAFGTGDIPSGTSSNALRVFDGNYGAPRPATREPYVAWPPPGYVPYGVIYKSWSLSDAGVDFSGASVTMTRNGVSYAVTRQTPSNGYGENTLVWNADAISDFGTLPPPAADTPFTVSITGAVAGGVARSYSYTVTAFDPAATTATAPGTPTGVTASAGNAAATVSWSPPASNGGSAVTGYQVTASPGGATASTDGSGRSAVLSGLTNGTSYTFTVTARNAVGTGPASTPSNAVTPKAPSTATTAQDGLFTYDTWARRVLSGASGGTYRSSGTAGSTASFTFTGTRVTWLARGGPAMGKAQVLVDGVGRGTVDLYRPTNQAVSLSYGPLKGSRHTLTIRVLGTRNSSSTGTQVGLDAVKVGTTTTQDGAVTLTYGGWAGGANSSASGGTLRRSSTPGATASMAFTGTSVDLVTAVGPAYGSAELHVDGVDEGTVDLYAPTQQWRAVRSVSGLSPGAHVLTVTVVPSDNPASTGDAVVVDALVAHA